MRSFLAGFITAILIALSAGFCFIRFGFIDPRADARVSTFESKIAMPSLDAAVDRRAPKISPPLPASEDNLMAGMEIYQSSCASCHGDARHPHSALANAFYPRVPQFTEDPPDMPENQNFYIIQHGIRLSGMPGWRHLLDDRSIWQVTLFLSHMDKLSPQILNSWRATAAGSFHEKTPSPELSNDMKK